MDYFDALRAICQPIRAADYPRSVESMRRLLQALGSPQQTFPSVVVAGSVGKGTVCHQLAALLADTMDRVPTDKGLNIGLYTSPHLHSFRERFVINGQIIAQASFVRGMVIVQEAAQTTGERYSTFELATALVLWWFREQAVNIAVLEVGIGGRWDAVNIVSNVLGVITPIEMEHAAMLGGTLYSIAAHKAGIIQPGRYVISTIQSSEVAAVLRQEAEQKAATLEFVPYDQLAQAAILNLMQQGQIPNTPLPDITPAVYMPGRMEFVTRGSQQIVIDGAHTTLAAARLRVLLDHEWHDEPVLLVMGMLRDKAVPELLKLFDDKRFHIMLTKAPSHRALSAPELRALVELTQAAVTIEPDLNTALHSALESSVQRVLITGSLRMAAAAREYLGLLDENMLEEARATRAIFEGESYLKRLDSDE